MAYWYSAEMLAYPIVLTSKFMYNTGMQNAPASLESWAQIGRKTVSLPVFPKQ